jgi:hypothetical protein
LRNILNAFFANGAGVALLVDKEGLSRASGKLAAMVEDTPEGAAITLEDGSCLLLKNIVGVNGIFHSHYSEC